MRYAFDVQNAVGRDVRDGEMTLTVEDVTAAGVRLRLDGHGHTGPSFDEYRSSTEAEFAENGSPMSYGMQGRAVRLLGFLHYNAKKKAFDRFDIVGVTDTWGILATLARVGDREKRETGLKRRRWPVGIAIELVTGDRVADRIPPGGVGYQGGKLEDDPYFR